MEIAGVFTGRFIKARTDMNLIEWDLIDYSLIDLVDLKEEI